MGGIGISPFLPTMDAWILESMLVMTNNCGRAFRGHGGELMIDGGIGNL
jgi:hypothetical protein